MYINTAKHLVIIIIIILNKFKIIKIGKKRWNNNKLYRVVKILLLSP